MLEWLFMRIFWPQMSRNYRIFSARAFGARGACLVPFGGVHAQSKAFVRAFVLATFCFPYIRAETVHFIAKTGYLAVHQNYENFSEGADDAHEYAFVPFWLENC